MPKAEDSQQLAGESAGGHRISPDKINFTDQGLSIARNLPRRPRNPPRATQSSK